MPIPMKVVPGYFNSRPGIQVGTWYKGDVTVHDDDTVELDQSHLRFLRQMGVEWVMVATVPRFSARIFKSLRQAFEAEGLKLFRVGYNRLHQMPPITLNLEGRDKMIEDYLRYINDLGEAGLHYATYGHVANGIWRGLERRPVRGGATAGGLDLEKPMRAGKMGYPGEFYELPLSYGREYGKEELWENFYYFVDKLVPVLEKSGVFLGVHPSDPPVYTFGGVPRHIFGTFEGYKQALDYANSPNFGACLCVGSWLEGGGAIGCTPEEFIRYFGGRKKLFKLHVRNVTAPLSAPGGFNETFPDAGYGDLISVIKTLDEIGFDGPIINDHLIDMVGAYHAAEAYFTAYLKGMTDAVQHGK